MLKPESSEAALATYMGLSRDILELMLMRAGSNPAVLLTGALEEELPNHISVSFPLRGAFPKERAFPHRCLDKKNSPS